jgi:hypothetical protein
MENVSGHDLHSPPIFIIIVPLQSMSKAEISFWKAKASLLQPAVISSWSLQASNDDVC